MRRMRAFIAGYARSIDAWTLAHRCGAMALATAMALTVGLHFQTASSAADLRAQRAAIEALKARIRFAEKLTVSRRAGDAQRALNAPGQHTSERRPALNHGLADIDEMSSTLPDDAGLLQMFAPALDIADLKLDAFEPGESTETSDWRERRVQLRVSGAFAALTECAARLETLPLTVVPVAARLRTQAKRHLLEVSLRVIGMRAADRLPLAKTVRSSQAPLPDPFIFTDAPAQRATEAGPLQFIGLLRRGRARAALVQSPAGIQLLRTGDLFEGMKVQRIDDAALLLSGGATVQRLLALRAPDVERQRPHPPMLGKKP